MQFQKYFEDKIEKIAYKMQFLHIIWWFQVTSKNNK